MPSICFTKSVAWNTTLFFFYTENVRLVLISVYAGLMRGGGANARSGRHQKRNVRRVRRLFSSAFIRVPLKNVTRPHARPRRIGFRVAGRATGVHASQPGVKVAACGRL